ncbi:MAG: ABC transporter ATP-binding protein [Eggerthella lenta]
MMPNHDPQAPAIELAHLTFAYEGSAPQLEDVNLTVQPGEVVVLTGPSGGGKSTLTRVVNGLVPSFYEGELTGTVRLFGREVDDIPSWERGLAAGNVFQDPRSQFFANEVAGEIAFGCENYGLDHELIVERVHGAASELDIAPLLEEKVRLLSYGMRQRVAIASAKAIDPPLYVMDEPPPTSTTRPRAARQPDTRAQAAGERPCSWPSIACTICAASPTASSTSPTAASPTRSRLRNSSPSTPRASRPSGCAARTSRA